MRTVLYAGSFDPFTNGHADIVKKASLIFDEVIIGVANNNSKKNLLSIEKRVELIKQSIKHIKNAKVVSYEGLTVEFAKRNNVSALLRGLRTAKDFDYESEIEQINSTLAKEIPTVYMTSENNNRFISSTSVRELISAGADISEFVPKPIFEEFNK